MAENIVYVNVEEGSRRVMNNIKLYVKLLGKFMEDKSMSQIDEALNNNDLASAQNLIHAVKGLAANLSLTDLYKHSVELETQVKAGAVDRQQVDNFKDSHARKLTEVEKVIAKYA